MADDVESVTRSVIKAAKGGDMTAAKLILDRIAPPRRDRPISVALPEIETARDALGALGALVAAMAAGDLTPEEAQRAGAVIENAIRIGKMADLQARIEALEKVTKP